ncbi:MAG: hypothetical protein IJU12_07940 [Clostridia bacterium]|nr:hypothetical protein [Clostridia bacterium]
MKKQLTVGQYRAMDLFFFALMMVISESGIVLAATRWFPNEPYTVSVVAAVVAIVMIRWGPWAAVHAALGGVVFCLVSGAAPRQYLIYCGGNLLALPLLFFIKQQGADAIRRDSFKTVAYGLLTLLLMEAGRALLSLILGASPAAAAGFFTTDIISWLFTALILWIARRLDGIMEDQKQYLHRVAQEREEEKGGF